MVVYKQGAVDAFHHMARTKGPGKNKAQTGGKGPKQVARTGGGFKYQTPAKIKGEVKPTVVWQRGSIEQARKELEIVTNTVKQSRKKLSKAAHRFLLEGMEHCATVSGDGASTIASATHLLGDENLTVACDARKYNHIDANEHLKKARGSMEYAADAAPTHNRFLIHAVTMDNITGQLSQKKKNRSLWAT